MWFRAWLLGVVAGLVALIALQNLTWSPRPPPPAAPAPIPPPPPAAVAPIPPPPVGEKQLFHRMGNGAAIGIADAPTMVYQSPPAHDLSDAGQGKTLIRERGQYRYLCANEDSTTAFKFAKDASCEWTMQSVAPDAYVLRNQDRVLSVVASADGSIAPAMIDPATTDDADRYTWTLWRTQYPCSSESSVLPCSEDGGIVYFGGRVDFTYAPMPSDVRVEMYVTTTFPTTRGRLVATHIALRCPPGQERGDVTLTIVYKNDRARPEDLFVADRSTDILRRAPHFPNADVVVVSREVQPGALQSFLRMRIAPRAAPTFSGTIFLVALKFRLLADAEALVSATAPSVFEEAYAWFGNDFDARVGIEPAFL